MRRLQALLLLMTCSLLAALVLARPDRAFVSHVVFEGASRATPAQLRHLAEVRNGVRLWQVDPAVVAEGVVRHPWVAEARVERRWPDTVRVTVLEHEPVALLAFDTGMFYVDHEGVPFLPADTTDLDHPLITGITLAEERAHPDLPIRLVREALSLIEQLDARGLVARAEVSEVSFAATRGFSVQLRGVRAGRLLFGLGESERQLDHLAALVEQHGLDPAAPQQIDLAPPSVAIVKPIPTSPTGYAGLTPR